MNTRNDQQIEINGEQVDEVREFGYLGALMDKEGGTTKDIQHRLSEARQAFYRMPKIWHTSEIWQVDKGTMFKTIVRSILMYGCEDLERIQVHEEDFKNKVASDHLPPTNPGEHSSEKNKR